jgi:hypothetical protein
VIKTRYNINVGISQFGGQGAEELRLVYNCFFKMRVDASHRGDSEDACVNIII